MRDQAIQRLSLPDPLLISERSREILEECLEAVADLGMSRSIEHVGLHVAELVAAVVALSLDLVGIDLLLPHEEGDGVGKLDLVACSGRSLLQKMPDFLRQDVASYYSVV